MLGDTIFAVASPPGAALRGVLRISGPSAWSVAAALVGELPRVRGAHQRQLIVLGQTTPCLVLALPGPGSFTGEDTVELHCLGSPLLLQRLQEQLSSGAREATPGEFTRRAFENGRLDLAQAEAVQALIVAADAEQRRRAWDALSGGLGDKAALAREAVLDALALVEGELDVAEDEALAPSPRALAAHLARAREALGDVCAGAPRVAIGGEIALAGAANAGKSSLVNALAGRECALVDARPGTTRDVIAVEIAPGVTVLDTPGEVVQPSPLDAAAGASRERTTRERARGVVWVEDLAADADPPPADTPVPLVAVVGTKRDLPTARTAPRAPLGVAAFVVSSRDGTGIEALRAFLVQRSTRSPRALGARTSEAAGRALEGLARAEAAAGRGEIVAFELRDALAALEAVAGRATPEDVLDRIFESFCLGK